MKEHNIELQTARAKISKYPAPPVVCNEVRNSLDCSATQNYGVTKCYGGPIKNTKK